MYLYGGVMGAFLSSGNASSFDLNSHPWGELQDVIEWLHNNNPLFQNLFTLSKPQSHPRIDHMNITGQSSSNCNLAGKPHLGLYFESSLI